MANKKARGKRAKTRRLLKRGSIPKPSVNKQMQVFGMGDRVGIKIDPSIHSGMPDARYQGLTGTVVGKQGRVFNVEVRKGFLTKHVLLSAGHLDPEKRS